MLGSKFIRKRGLVEREWKYVIILREIYQSWEGLFVLFWSIQVNNKHNKMPIARCQY